MSFFWKKGKFLLNADSSRSNDHNSSSSTVKFWAPSFFKTELLLGAFSLETDVVAAVGLEVEKLNPIDSVAFSALVDPLLG